MVGNGVRSRRSSASRALHMFDAPYVIGGRTRMSGEPPGSARSTPRRPRRSWSGRLRALAVVEHKLAADRHALDNADRGRPSGPTATLARDGWDAELAANLTSKFLATKHELPRMVRGSAILNVSSIAGAAAYSAAMQGVLGLTRAVAMEYAEQGIRVNAMILGGVDTPLFRSTMGATDDAATSIRSLHPLGRLATPEEIARTIVFLVSGASSFITGAALTSGAMLSSSALAAADHRRRPA